MIVQHSLCRPSSAFSVSSHSPELASLFLGRQASKFNGDHGLADLKTLRLLHHCAQRERERERMFDSLLGRKFSNKCKHSVKCIRCRMEMIRKKKHAMVRYLKKDVADLVSGGHEANAFGRMDALIVEINQSSCYDMIEQYCFCILEHLPTMQKERVCPEETVEAVATLIFAAARFSDLPELADLRRWFTDRYGTHMEAYINGEFVEKMQKKSFPEDKKLQLMQDIAQEFSVNWDMKAFKFKDSKWSAPTSDQAKIYSLSSNENNKQSYMLGGRREVIDGSEFVNGGKSVLNKSESLNCAYQVSDIEKQKTKFEPKNVEVLKEEQKIIQSVRNEQHRGFAMQKQQIKPVERMDFHTHSNSANGYTHDLADTENVEPRYFEKRAAHVASKSNPNGNHTKEWIGEGNIHKISEGLGSIGTERQGAASMVSRDTKTVNMTPPYTKYGGYFNRTSSCLDDGFALSTSADLFKEMDPNGQESQTNRTVNPENNRAFNLKPPYVKPSIRKSSLETNYVKPTNKEVSGGGDLGDCVKNAPFSVRRKSMEQAAASNADSIVEDGVSRKINMHDNQQSISRHSKQTENDAIYYGRRMSRTFNDQPRHGNGHGTTTIYDGECNQEEEIMDKLLLRYSKGKDGTRMKETLKQPILDSARISENPIQVKHPNISLHAPTRIASMPTEPNFPPATVVKSHMRAASMQPELLSPNDRRVHPRLPDYDDLASRIAELRKS